MSSNRNKFGLTERDISTIKDILCSCSKIEMVHLFGSRAKGNYRLGSDIDLAIMNEGVSAEELSKLQGKFEDSSLPYKVDLVDFTSLKKEEFINHIKSVGTPFFEYGQAVSVN
jgi:predicted nucleotidyltransferase